MKIAITGSNGLIGSRFKSLLEDKFDLTGLIASNNFDIRDKEKVFIVMDDISPDIILHFAAKTNVDDCENDKMIDEDKLLNLKILQDDKLDLNKIESVDWKNDNTAFAINVLGTKNLVDYAKKNNIKFIYVSTDFIFDGESGNYDETSIPNPVNWYGKTKFFGEKIVKENLEDYIIARLSYPYGYKSDVRKDFVWRMIELMEKSGSISLLEDHIFTPTFMDDIIFSLELLIKRNYIGIFNLVGSVSLSPYEAGVLINGKFFNNKINIFKMRRNEFYKGKAKRGCNLSMKNDKIEKLGLSMKSFSEGIDLIHKTI